MLKTSAGLHSGVISFDAKPAVDTAPAKTSRTPLGALFQNVLQKENSSLSPFQKGEEPSQDTPLEGLLHELKQWLSNKEDSSFNEDWLNSLQQLEELNASPRSRFRSSHRRSGSNYSGPLISYQELSF